VNRQQGLQKPQSRAELGHMKTGISRRNSKEIKTKIEKRLRGDACISRTQKKD
jgi:hypothetical protein